MGGHGQMLTFAYMVGGWVRIVAYIIKRIIEKWNFWKLLKVGKSQKQFTTHCYYLLKKNICGVGGFLKILRNFQSGSWQMLTSAYKVGGWGEKRPKTCLRNTWMVPYRGSTCCDRPNKRVSWCLAKKCFMLTGQEAFCWPAFFSCMLTGHFCVFAICWPAMKSLWLYVLFFGPVFAICWPAM